MKKNFMILSAICFSNIIWAQPEINKDAADWLNKNCVPLKYVTAKNGFEDLKPLNDLIGDARIVSLGECTHGSSEIFSMKHRMLEYLVKEKGFTIFQSRPICRSLMRLMNILLMGKAIRKN